MAQGRFREDLYHRLSVFPLNVPSLRERIDDIPLLSGFILNNIKGKIGTNNVRVSKTVMHKLMQYDWPGNVRELQHVLMRAALRAAANADGKVAIIEPRHLGMDFTDDSSDMDSGAADHVEGGKRVSLVVTEGKSFNDLLGDFQRQLITQAMEDNDHVWAKAARQLKLDRGNLYRQAKRLGLT